VAEQIVVLLAATAGYFDQIGIEELAKIELLLREALVEQHGELCQKINKGEELEKEELRTLKRFAKVFLRDRKE